jgi:hypothetical protein
MRFHTLILAGFAAVASCIPAEMVANNINQITTLSRNLQTPAKGLTILDGPLLAVGQGNFPVCYKCILQFKARNGRLLT